jgi:hypothetical protein
MFETLLSPSEIKLYGRELTALHLLGANATRGANGAVEAARKAAGKPKTSPSAADVVEALDKYRRELTDPDERIAADFIFKVAVAVADGVPPAAPLVASPTGTAQAVLEAVIDRASDFNYSTALGGNQFLKQQLLAEGAGLARIYGFSFEGHYYDLPRPALFLVHGSGDLLEHGEHERTTLDTSGVMAREWEFSDSKSNARNVRKWSYDKGDFSIRLDVETGPFEQILLAAVLRGGSPLASGSDLRTSGSDLRTSGSDLRISGSDLRRR